MPLTTGICLEFVKWLFRSRCLRMYSDGYSIACCEPDQCHRLLLLVFQVDRPCPRLGGILAGRGQKRSSTAPGIADKRRTLQPGSAALGRGPGSLVCSPERSLHPLRR